MRPSPFVLENPNVLLVSELDWPPERDRIPHETTFLLCPRPMRSHAIGVAESLPSCRTRPLKACARCTCAATMSTWSLCWRC